MAIRHKTLYNVTKKYNWDWFIGTTINKGHRHQLYYDGFLYKTRVDRNIMPWAYGSDLNAAAFSISIKGFKFLCKEYPGTTVDEMKYDIFAETLNSGIKIFAHLKNSEGFYKRSGERLL